MIKKNSPRWIFADFCEITSKTIIKTCARFHFVINLFRVIMTVDLTNSLPQTFLSIKNYKDYKLYITQKPIKWLRKGQLLLVLSFLGRLLFATRNRLNSCTRNQPPFCSFRITFQSKSRLSSLSKFRDSILK